jgi:hypothetical protein
MPSDEVHLPLVNFPHAANPNDIFEVGIGEVDPAFDNSHDLNTTSCRSSSCDDIDDDDTNEHEFLDAPTTLDHMVWPAKLLHNPETLAKRRRHHRGSTKHRKGKGNGNDERYGDHEMRETGVGDHGDLQRSTPAATKDCDDMA